MSVENKTNEYLQFRSRMLVEELENLEQEMQIYQEELNQIYAEIDKRKDTHQ